MKKQMKLIAKISLVGAIAFLTACSGNSKDDKANGAPANQTEQQAFIPTPEAVSHCKTLPAATKLLGSWQQSAQTDLAVYTITVVLDYSRITVTKECQFRNGQVARAQASSQVNYNPYNGGGIQVLQSQNGYPWGGGTYPADCSVKLQAGALPYQFVGGCLQMGADQTILYYPNQALNLTN